MDVREAVRPEHLARLKELRLMDDNFMTKCFEDAPECVELVLRIVLGIPDLTVVESRTQAAVANLINRSVRLDILASDSTGRRINVEIQRSDKGAGRRRARFHSSMMDAGLLDRGDDFDSLPETYVVFITERDVIGRGEALYQFDRCDLRTGESFGDGAHIVYVNGAYRDQSPIGWLMHDFSCTDPGQMYYEALAKRTRYFKEGEGVPEMCRQYEQLLEEGRREGRQEGRREGRQEGQRKARQANAKAMLEDGELPLDKIAKYSSLSLEEVRRLAAELDAGTA